MLVKNWMRKDFAKIEEDDSIQHALSVMHEHKIRMLPVFKGGDLVGIVSNFDIRRVIGSAAAVPGPLLTTKIHDIMTPKPITIPQDYTIGEAAKVLMEHDISGLPVTDGDGKMVGIITKDEFYNILIRLSGMDRLGVELAVVTEDKPGFIEVLTGVTSKYEARIASILTTYEDVPDGDCIVYLRIFDVDRSTLYDLVDELNQKTKLIYMVDHRDGRRFV